MDLSLIFIDNVVSEQVEQNPFSDCHGWRIGKYLSLQVMI